MLPSSTVIIDIMRFSIPLSSLLTALSGIIVILIMNCGMSSPSDIVHEFYSENCDASLSCRQAFLPVVNSRLKSQLCDNEG